MTHVHGISVRNMLDTQRLRLLRRLKVERENNLKHLVSLYQAGQLPDEPVPGSSWRIIQARDKIKQAEFEVREVCNAIERELDREMTKLGHRPSDEWVELDNKKR